MRRRSPPPGRPGRGVALRSTGWRSPASESCRPRSSCGLSGSTESCSAAGVCGEIDVLCGSVAGRVTACSPSAAASCEEEGTERNVCSSVDVVRTMSRSVKAAWGEAGSVTSSRRWPDEPGLDESRERPTKWRSCGEDEGARAKANEMSECWKARAAGQAQSESARCGEDLRCRTGAEREGETHFVGRRARWACAAAPSPRRGRPSRPSPPSPMPSRLVLPLLPSPRCAHPPSSPPALLRRRASGPARRRGSTP